AVVRGRELVFEAIDREKDRQRIGRLEKQRDASGTTLGICVVDPTAGAGERCVAAHGCTLSKRHVDVASDTHRVVAAVAGEDLRGEPLRMRTTWHEMDGAGERTFRGSHRGRALDHFAALEAPSIPVAYADIGVGHAHAVVEV